MTLTYQRLTAPHTRTTWISYTRTAEDDRQEQACAVGCRDVDTGPGGDRSETWSGDAKREDATHNTVEAITITRAQGRDAAESGESGPALASLH
jgi:hypothetical protein